MMLAFYTSLTFVEIANNFVMKKLLAPIILLSIALVTSGMTISFASARVIGQFENDIVGTWQSEVAREAIMVFEEGGKGREYRTNFNGQTIVLYFNWSITESVLAIWCENMKEKHQDYRPEFSRIVELSSKKMVLSSLEDKPGSATTNVLTRLN